MHTSDEIVLLRRYAETRDEAAFTEVVRRNLDVVYSVALRRVGGDRHLAQDVAQQVFVALASDARRLSRHPALSGWLYHATRYTAANLVRRERRRKNREQEAQSMEASSAEGPSKADWNQVAPMLEEAIDTLGESDRIAILLRFFDRQSFREIGATLRLSEDAARKRVERALEKLRHALSRHGVTSTASALGATLMQHTVSAAPAGLVTTVAGAAFGGVGPIAGPLIFMGMTKLQVGVAAALVVAGMTGLISQYRTIGELRDSNAGLQEQLALSTGEIERDSRSRAAIDAELVALRAEIIALKSNASAPADNSTPLVGSIEAKRVGPAPAQRDSESLYEKKEKLRRRYAPFFAQRRLSPAQGERFIELKLMQFDANQDLQDSVRAANMRGDAAGVEALRAKISEPIRREMRELLGGKEGYAAYGAFETSSFYRLAFVDRLLPALASAQAPLSAAQADQLVAVIAANDRPQRVDPTSISTRTQIDWDSVASQSKTFLNPMQQSALQIYIEKTKAR